MKSALTPFPALLLCLALLLVSVIDATAQEKVMTAFSALKCIPVDQQAKLVRIEARDGAPNPAQWHVIVHDVQARSGFRDYVVESFGKVEARDTSEFVDAVSPAEVMQFASLKLDSDEALKQLEARAAAHGIALAKVNYTLRKEGPDAAPLWKLSCLDTAGRTLATLTLLASDGTVVAQTGFTPVIVSPENAAEDAAFLKQTELTGNPAPAETPTDEVPAGTQTVSSIESKTPEKKEPSAKKPIVSGKASDQSRTVASRKRAKKASAVQTVEGVELENFLTGKNPRR